MNVRALLLAGVSAFSLSVSAAQAQTAQPRISSTQAQIDELKRLIAEQQRMIQALEDRVRQSETSTTAAQSAATEAKENADAARKAIAEKPLVVSSNPRLKVALSGQVSRLLNLADDGKSTKAYFVDNNVSVSRLRVAATGEITDDLTVGTTIEMAISPNNSADVSQVNEDGSQRDEFRKVEALLKSKAYGDVQFGKGDPATKDIARLDLSGTDVLAYAPTGDPAGGLLFRTKDDDELTTTNVASVFTDFDAGRTNRIRYDTPKFSGAYASASFGADQKWGVAARWAGTGHGLQATAGAGVQDPSSSTADLVYAGSASVLHEGTGLNLTYGTAFRDQDEGTGELQYVKAGWQHDFFTVGKTAFSLDFGLDEDVPTKDDDGKTVGLVALQNLSAYGTELFVGFRGYDFDDGDGPDTSTIYVGTAGTRIRF
jgi:hypothetical protein